MKLRGLVPVYRLCYSLVFVLAGAGMPNPSISGKSKSEHHDVHNQSNSSSSAVVSPSLTETLNVNIVKIVR